MSSETQLSEWNSLLDKFRALVGKDPSCIEDIFDAQFRLRFGRLIDQAVKADWRRWDDEPELKLTPAGYAEIK